MELSTKMNEKYIHQATKKSKSIQDSMLVKEQYQFLTSSAKSMQQVNPNKSIVVQPVIFNSQKILKLTCRKNTLLELAITYL